MAAAFTAAMLITAATRSAIGHLVDVMDEPLPGVDVLRYATALNYQVLGLAAMGALALTILATSVLALRTGAFGRWAALGRSRLRRGHAGRGRRRVRRLHRSAGDPVVGLPRRRQSGRGAEGPALVREGERGSGAS